MGRSLLLMVTLGVLTLLGQVHVTSSHPLLSNFQHPSRHPDIALADEAMTEANQNDDITRMLQRDIELAPDDRSIGHKKLSIDDWRRLRNVLQKLGSSVEDVILAYGSQVPTLEIETIPSSSHISPTVLSKKSAARLEVNPIPSSKRSGPLAYHKIPLEVVEYVLQGWRDHSARQQALEAALEDAGMRLPAGWRGRDDLSVGLDVEVLKVIIADMNRHLHQGQQRDTQSKLARIGKRSA